MNESVSFKRWLAHALLRRAQKLLPTSRLEWAKAMQTELDHLENDGDALTWAMGCVVAGLMERISTMLAANLKISRWILLPEMLLCFVPLTLDWLDVIAGSSGIIQLNGHIIQKYFLHAPGGTFALVTMIAGAVLGTLGPLGLTAAFRLIVSGRRPGSRWFRAALVAGPAVYGLLTTNSGNSIGNRWYGRIGFRRRGQL
jgi:hypothetical protein